MNASVRPALPDLKSKTAPQRAPFLFGGAAPVACGASPGIFMGLGESLRRVPYSVISTTSNSRSDAPRAWDSASWYSGE